MCKDCGCSLTRHEHDHLGAHSHNHEHHHPELHTNPQLNDKKPYRLFTKFSTKMMLKRAIIVLISRRIILPPLI